MQDPEDGQYSDTKSITSGEGKPKKRRTVRCRVKQIMLLMCVSLFSFMGGCGTMFMYDMFSSTGGHSGNIDDIFASEDFGAG